MGPLALEARQGDNLCRAWGRAWDPFGVFRVAWIDSNIPMGWNWCGRLGDPSVKTVGKLP